MNYIKRIEADLQTAQDKLAAMKEEIHAFRKHLQSSKFVNTETERNDWISVADVQRWLDNIVNAE
jgi:hypothetical protein